VVLAAAAVIVVIVVVVIVVVADRLLARAAEGQVARRIAAASRAAAAPAVRIGGASFLTQLAAGRYREVDVTLGAFSIGGVEFAGLAARLSEVQAPLGRLRAGGGVLAGRVSGTATIPLAALASKLPPGLALRRQGSDLAVVGSTLPMPVSGVLRVTAGSQQISVTPMVLGIPSLVGFVIAMPSMPAELTIESVLVGDAGLEVALSGDNVLLGAADGW